MSRNFVRTSSQYLEVDSPPVTAAPFTVSAWVWSSEGSNEKTAVFIGDKDSSSKYWKLEVDVSERVLWEANAGTPARARSGVVFALSQWNHLVGVERSATDREVYYNGASQATNTTNVAPTGADRISVGRNGSSAPTTYWDGNLAELGIWDVALNTDEITALSKGVSPLLIRPGSLVFYLPMVRDADKDIVGGLALTASGSPTVADHPRVFNLAGGHVGQATAGGAVDLVIQAAVHAQSAENVTLTQVHTLAIQDVSVGQTAANVDLSQVHSLAVQGATHGQAAESLVLGQVHSLAIDAALHGQGAGNVTLTQVHGLEVDSSSHTHLVDGVSLGQVHSLAVDAASHGQMAESLLLSQVHVLSVANTLHGQMAEEVALGGGGFDEHVIRRGERRGMERRME